MTGRATRLGVVAALWVALAVGAVPIRSARADTFTATWRELARSPQGAVTTWYSGGVTKDGKFVYGHGASHGSQYNNSMWLYDPATNTHAQLQPSTGQKFRWDTDAAGNVVAKSGRWTTLDPVADKALYDYFGGPDIKALTNRNNHQAFYMRGVDQFWVMNGTWWDHDSPYAYGRFDLKTQRWAYVSKPWSDPTKSDLVDFSAGMVAGTPIGWAAPNAATATCPDIDAVVMFGGMSDKTGTVRMIERNAAGAEVTPGAEAPPYRWATGGKVPFYVPAENVRHNAACAGDTVYFVEGQQRWPNEAKLRTPNPAAFWKFHVPSRTWTKLTGGPPGGYFPMLTYDPAANALLLYGPGSTGSGSNKLWVYDLAVGAWHDLTGTVPNLPRVDMLAGGYVPGFGHLYKGGRFFKPDGTEEDYTHASRLVQVVLKRGAGVSPPVAKAVVRAPLAQRDPDNAQQLATVAVPNRDQPIAKRVRDREQAGRPNAPTRARVPSATGPSPQAQEVAAGMNITWAKIPLPGKRISPVGTMKHQRIVEGPNGRVYLLGGDWGGDWGENSGRQEVYSFDPLSATGDWRLEAPYCGTVANPVHWHTDEAGAVWDAKRKIFWKLAGVEYGPDDACLAAGKSVKAKVITFDPATGLWTVPPYVSQMRFWYVTNGVIDPVRDEIIQITDQKAFHLNLTSGQWSEYPLWGEVKRFNAITARVGRVVYWTNRDQVLESYNLDTHALTQHSVAPWPVPPEGWEMEIVMPYGDKVLVVKPVSRTDTVHHAAVYDPATKAWTTLAQGEGWGNTGMVHSSGKLILMGGGIDGPEHYNKQVWVGTVGP